MLNKPFSLLIVMLLLMSASSYSKVIASYGGLSKVEEIDIRHVIFKRLKELEKKGEFKKFQEQSVQKIQNQLEHPKRVELSPTANPEIFYVDPSIRINQNIYDSKGDLIAKEGEVINPFEKINYQKTLMFFDAGDIKQTEWVERNYQKFNHVKFILTGGSIKDASARFGRVYFDWEGILSQKLHIQHVPSVVQQKALKWQITEVSVI